MTTAQTLSNFSQFLSGTTGSLSHRNKLINGNFDIWQRGTSISAGSTGTIFAADRWGNASAGTTYAASQQAFTLGQTDVPNEPTYFHRIVVTSVAGAANVAQIFQRLEGVRTLAGQQAVLSFYAKADSTKNIAVSFNQFFGSSGGSGSVSGIKPTQNQVTLTTSWKKYVLYVTFPSVSGKTIGTAGDDCVQMNFWFDAGSNFNSDTGTLGQQSGTFDIAQVQLEAGNIATNFEMRPKQIELALCQRYYWIQYAPNGLVSSPATNGAVIQYQCPVIMRSVPTIATNMTSGNYVATAPTASQWNLQQAAVAYSGVSSGSITIGPTMITINYFALSVYGMVFNISPNLLVAGTNVYVSASAEF